MSEIKRFCSKQYNLDKNNSDYLTRNWRTLERNYHLQRKGFILDNFIIKNPTFL